MTLQGERPYWSWKVKINGPKNLPLCGSHLNIGPIAQQFPDRRIQKNHENLVTKAWQSNQTLVPNLGNSKANPSDSHETYQKAELEILRAAQKESFPEETQCLTAGKPVPSTSRLALLTPELDKEVHIIRVGGRLHRCNQLEPEMVHPILLDPKHQVTRMLIWHVDNNLKNPGSERLLSNGPEEVHFSQGQAC